MRPPFSDHLDAETLLLRTISDRTKAVRAMIALSKINGYLLSARFQIGRIWGFLSMAESHSPDWSMWQTQSFQEIHFYSICWAKIWKMMQVVRDCSGFQSVKLVCRRHRIILERYTDLRDQFEHYDERMPAGKKNQSLSHPGDLGNLSGKGFTLGGKHWDVSPASLAELEKIVADLNAEIHLEGLTRYQDQQLKNKELS